MTSSHRNLTCSRYDSDIAEKLPTWC